MPFFCSLVFQGLTRKDRQKKSAKKIDQSVEEVKNAAEEAGDEFTNQGSAAALGEKIDDSVEQVKETVTSKTE